MAKKDKHAVHANVEGDKLNGANTMPAAGETIHPNDKPAEDTNDAVAETPESAPEATGDVVESTSAPHVDAGAQTPKPRHGFVAWLKDCVHRHKARVAIAAVVVVLGVLAAVPWTRFKVAALFLKQTVTITVTDSQTHAPITSATVADGNLKAQTDNQGRAHLHVAVGSAAIVVSKAYYQSATLHAVVPISKPKHGLSASLMATGRQVPITVANKIGGAAISNAVVSAVGSEVKTDAKGQAVIVLPADKTSVSASVKADGFNDGTVTIQVTASDVAANHFQITPTGQVYFLSNLSGKIDVVKTNLDGSSRQTVLAGTGNEDAQNTVLLATRDWRYLALLSKRDGGNDAKLFLIDTSSDKVTTMDEGGATFSPAGWDGHNFIYTVHRDGVGNWQPGQEALKSFNADKGTLTQLDQSQASGTSNNDAVQERFGGVYILDGAVVYAKDWDFAFSQQWQIKNYTTELDSIMPDGSAHKKVQAFGPANGATISYLTLDITPYEANGLYLHFYDGNNDRFYTYANGAVKDDPNLSYDQFDASYPTFLLSPSGNQTFWQDQSDGKNALFVGDKDGNNATRILRPSDYDVYGWFTENYLLASKKGSELYILPVGDGTPLKISDYYKPAQNYNGYGSGYGGL